MAEEVKMSIEQYQLEYERLLGWRDRWTRLSAKFEPGRLASRQERIEDKAHKANQAIGKLINAFDAQQRELEKQPPFPFAPHPINENEVRNRVGRVIYDIFGPQRVRRKNPSKLARQCAELQERFTTLITNMPPIVKDQPQ